MKTPTKSKSKTRGAGKPAKKPARKYSVYNAMEIALRSDGFLSPGALGGYLMDKFLADDGYISLKEATENKFLENEELEIKITFSDWRALLVEKKWLIYDQKKAVASNTLGLCSPGKRLNRYLNKEKFLQEELVTTRMLKAELSTKVSLQEFQDFKKEFDDMRSGMQIWMKTYLAINPPDTPARRCLLWNNMKRGIVGFTRQDEETESRSHPDYSSFIQN